MGKIDTRTLKRSEGGGQWRFFTAGHAPPVSSRRRPVSGAEEAGGGGAVGVSDTPLFQTRSYK